MRGVSKSKPLYQLRVPVPVQLSSKDWLLMETAESDGEMTADGRGMISSINEKINNDDDP